MNLSVIIVDKWIIKCQKIKVTFAVTPSDSLFPNS